MNEIYQEDLFFLSFFLWLFHRKVILFYRKAGYFFEGGTQASFSLCLEILDSEIPPEREVSLFQFQL